MKWFVTTFIMVACLPSSAQFYEKFAAELKAALPSRQAVEKVLEKFKTPEYGAIFSAGFTNKRINYLELECREYYLWHEEDSSNKGDLRRANTIEVYFSENLVAALKLSTHYKILLSYIDSSLLSKHFSRWKELHGIQFEKDEPFFISNQYDIFGIRWGLRATPFGVFQPMREIYELAYSGNQYNLVQLGKSLCNETRAYAAAGLFIIEKDGCELTQEASTLLQNLKISDVTLNYARGGCSIEEGKRMSRCLSIEFLDEIYRSYLYYKKSQEIKPFLQSINSALRGL